MDRQTQIQEVINRFGASFYFYDLDGFEDHLGAIRRILHPDIKVWYATKANPLSEVLRILRKTGFGADVASLGELHQVTSAGFEPRDLIATGPAKSKHYLGSLLSAKVNTIVVESLNQLRDLNDLCEKTGLKQNVLLRVQLAWESEGESFMGGPGITPFGLGPEDWKRIDVRSYPHLNFLGLHCFQWGNVLSADELRTIWTRTIRDCGDLARDLGIELDVLDLGGGLGFSYQDDREISFADVHDLLLELKAEFALKKIWLELGRFTIGKFGSYLTRVVDIKSVRGKDFVVTEGGINHLARPALVGESFPCRPLVWDEASPTKTYSIHGPLCTALDHLGTYALPVSLKVGDWLEFSKVGAYGFTESMPYFLCHSSVGEAFAYKDELCVPRAPTANLEWMV